jgi:hypothetical protein
VSVHVNPEPISAAQRNKLDAEEEEKYKKKEEEIQRHYRENLAK